MRRNLGQTVLGRSRCIHAGGRDGSNGEGRTVDLTIAQAEYLGQWIAPSLRTLRDGSAYMEGIRLRWRRPGLRGVRMTLFASRHLLESIVVIRQGAGYRDPALQGEWVPGPEVRTPVEGVTAPANRGTWRHVLTEGVRLADYREFRLPVSGDSIAPIRVGDGQTDRVT